jgi:hypothetical protein
MKNDELFYNYLNHDLHISSTDRFLYKFFQSLLPRIEKKENKVSIIIQGPLNERSIKTIPNYLRYGEVIVSCWDKDNLKQLDPFKDKIKIIVNKYKNVPKTHTKSGSQAPWIYQHFTTLNALKIASGNFSIKVRSDESFPILDQLIYMLKFNRDNKCPINNIYMDYKIITSNIYFRFDRENKFHPSDHIISGNTKRMIEIFEKAIYLCQNKNVASFPEQLFAKAVIETYFDKTKKRKDSCDPTNSTELMKKHFDIIRIKNLPNHVWTSSYRKYDKLYNEEAWCHHIHLIDS